MERTKSPADTAASAEHDGIAESPLQNWAGNLTYSTNRIHYPGTVEEVQALVRNSSRLRVLGSRHSFNPIADSREQLLCLQEMNGVVELNKKAHTVTIWGGTRYGDIAALLYEQGYALPNLASLPHITVAGACATATHGSGIGNRSLASSVSAIELVNGSGEVVKWSREKDGERFAAAVVNLGVFGVVTKLTLDLVPTFEMKQVVYLDLPMEVLEHHFDDIQSQAYSVSLFTDWKNGNIGEVWLKTKADPIASAPPELYGAKAATKTVHPINGQPAENVTEQMGVPGPWYERMPHFRMGFKPSAGAELQSEYFVPAAHAYKALRAIETVRGAICPHLFISEIRTIAADDLWLSPFYQRPSVAFHFTWKQQPEAVMRLLPLIEEKLAPYSARPHWGKLFTTTPEVLRSQYRRLADFRQLAEELDPTAKFRNEFVNRFIFD